MPCTSIVALCSVKKCGFRASRQGWCDPHYRRWYKYGDVQADNPLHLKSQMDSAALKIWHKVAVAAIDREWGAPPPPWWQPSEATKAAFREWLGLQYVDGNWVDPHVEEYKKNGEILWRRLET